MNSQHSESQLISSISSLAKKHENDQPEQILSPKAIISQKYVQPGTSLSSQQNESKSSESYSFSKASIEIEQQQRQSSSSSSQIERIYSKLSSSQLNKSRTSGNLQNSNQILIDDKSAGELTAKSGSRNLKEYLEGAILLSDSKKISAASEAVKNVEGLISINVSPQIKRQKSHSYLNFVSLSGKEKSEEKRKPQRDKNRRFSIQAFQQILGAKSHNQKPKKSRTVQEDSSSDSDDDLDSSQENIKNKLLEGPNRITDKKKQTPELLDFADLLAFSKPHRGSCVILSNNTYRIMWEFFVMFILIITTLIVPYRLAFIDEEPIEWVVVYYVFDGLFFVDCILNFFTSYPDEEKSIEVTELKKVALNYLKTWFLIDLLSFLPFDTIFDSTGTNSAGANSFAKNARIAKIYKIIRLFRLVKILKLVKSNRQLSQNFSEKMKINSGASRLYFFTFFFFVFMHVIACVFVIVAQLEQDVYMHRWTDKCLYNEDFEMYMCSLYFMMTTIATVGYGDISPQNAFEQSIGILIMFVGVISFTFVSGALASILQSYDSKEASYQEKMLSLNRLKENFDLNEELILNIRSALHFDAQKSDAYLNDLYQILPASVAMDLKMVVSRQTFSECKFFTKLEGNKYFITWIQSNLKPRLTNPTERLYSEGDIIDYFYFMSKGVSAFIKEQFNGYIIGLIDPKEILDLNKKSEGTLQTFQSFGCEDSVYNHLVMLIDLEKGKQQEIYKAGENALNKRHFTVECLMESEYFTMPFSVLDKMKKNFHSPSRNFYKLMIDQLKQLLTFDIYALRKQQNQKEFQKKSVHYNANKFRSKKTNYMKESAQRLNTFVNDWNMAYHEDKDLMKSMQWSISGDELIEEEPIVRKSFTAIPILVTPVGESKPSQSQNDQQFVLQGHSLTELEKAGPSFNLSKEPVNFLAKSLTKNLKQSVLRERSSRSRLNTVLSNFSSPSNKLKEQKTRAKDLQEYYKNSTGLSGIKKLAITLLIVKKMKEKNLNTRQALKEVMKEKMEKVVDVQIERQLLQSLPILKNEVLENLLVEQDFRCQFNSINTNERFLSQICEKQEALIENLQKNFDKQINMLREEVLDTKQMLTKFTENK